MFVHNLIGTGDLEEAQKRLDEATKLGYGVTNYNLGFVSLLQGNKAEASKNFKIAMTYLRIEEFAELDFLIDAYYDPSLRQE